MVKKQSGTLLFTFCVYLIWLPSCSPDRNSVEVEPSEDTQSSISLFESFNSDWIKNNMEYSLHDFDEFAELFSNNDSKLAQLEQGEFETQEEFSVRQEESQPLKSIFGNDFELESHFFAFPMNGDIRYDADESTHQISVRGFRFMYFENTPRYSQERQIRVTLCREKAPFDDQDPSLRSWSSCAIHYPMDRALASEMQLSRNAEIIGVVRFHEDLSLVDRGFFGIGRTACEDARQRGRPCRFSSSTHMKTADIDLVIDEIHLVNRNTGDHIKSWRIRQED